MKSLQEFLNESELTKSEKYWDMKFKKALKKFPDWYDEKVTIVNSIRQAYNELELDVIKGDKGYLEMLNWKDAKIYKDAKVFQDFATNIWDKLKGNEWAKQNALEDYLHWLK